MKGDVSLQSPFHLLSFPLSASTDATLSTLVFTNISYALVSLSAIMLRSSVFLRDLVSALQNNATLLDWARHIPGNSILEKTRDALLTRVYASLTKACSSILSNINISNAADLQSIFFLRIYALSCLVYTSPDTIKPSTFWEQVQKASLTYARASVETTSTHEKTIETATASYISQSLHGLVERMRNLGLSAFLEGRPFIGVCEIWMTVAKRVSKCLVSLLDFGKCRLHQLNTLGRGYGNFRPYIRAYDCLVGQSGSEIFSAPHRTKHHQCGRPRNSNWKAQLGA